MTRENGVSVIPCKVNGLNLNFIYDTGASDVSLSLTEANFMLKNGYLTENDFIGTQNYSDANGDIEEGVVINLRAIIIGGHTIKDVQATIIKNTKAPLLLGQSALSKLGIVQQDFNKNTLTIFNKKTSPQTPPIEKIISSDNQKPTKNEVVVKLENGWIQKISIIQNSKIHTAPKNDIKYYWYNDDNKSVETNIGDWGGPLLNGKVKIFDDLGKLRQICNFTNGQRNGEFKYFNEEGGLETQINYDLNGNVSLKDETGYIQNFTISYKLKTMFNADPNLNYSWYNEDRNQIEKSKGDWNGPLLCGTYKKYDSKGNLRYIENYKNGLLHGISKCFDDNGKLTYFFKHENGIISYSKIFYERTVFNLNRDSGFSQDGSACISSDYNKQTDTSLYFGSEGKLYRKELQKSDNIQVLEFWPNGKVRRNFSTNIEPLNHMRQGEYIEYYENGFIKVKGKYSEKGYPSGIWIVNKSNGTLRNKIIFRNDTIYSKNRDTSFIGISVHDQYSKDSMTRINWTRIGKWLVFESYTLKNNVTYVDELSNILYPIWRPESIENSKYPVFIENDTLETKESQEKFNEYLLYFDDYSIIKSKTPHSLITLDVGDWWRALRKNGSQ
jgi:clan AA aspartic protease (TIGR02281 family)